MARQTILRTVLAVAMLVAMLALDPSPAGAEEPAAGPAGPDAAALDSLQSASDGSVLIGRHETTGAVRFIGTESGSPLDVSGVSGDPAGAAEAFVDDHGALFGAAEGASLEAAGVESLPDAGSSALYRQEADGVPVLAGEVRVQVTDDAKVLSAGGEASAGPMPSTEPVIDAATAGETAVAAVAKQTGVERARLSATTPERWIYDPALLGGPPPYADPSLVWRTEVSAEDAAVRQLVLVDAENGGVSLRIDQIESALSRTVCDHTNTIGSTPCPPMTRSEGQSATGNADVDKAYDYSGDTYQFFHSRFGRDSLDDAGLPLHSRVRFCVDDEPCPYANAYWDGSQMTYGAGYAAADDVVGHEMTHGVKEFTSDLLYYYQSGAIDESLADVFGEFIDLTNGAGDDSPGVRWDLGEDLPIGAIRNMANPPAFGDPDRMTSPNYTGTADDQGGVHTNSGVNNKAAALMVDGGSFNGQTIAAIGLEKAAQIYYTVATGFLTSGSDYQDLGDALRQACSNLIGQFSIDAADCTQVGKAVTATEMSTVPPAAPGAEAPVCTSGTPVDIFSDDFESGFDNWTTSTPAGGGAWGGVGFYAVSGTTSVGAPDVDTTGDARLVQATGVTLPANAYLHFAHAYDTEATYDGGVVEYSTNGGASWTDVTVGGPSFTHNGYNDTLTGTNPIAGRGAFTGSGRGYGSSRVSLASLAGQNVRFRFRLTSDTDVGGWAWFVDDVRIYTCGLGSCTHPFSDVAAWVEDAVTWATCLKYMGGYPDNTFRGELPITRAQVANVLYNIAGAPNTAGLPPHGLSDVPAWVQDAVTWMVAKGYAEGYPDGTFKPNVSITRGQLTRMQYRVAGSPPGSPAHPFSDVPDWLTDSVNWIVDPANVPPYATGYPGGTYRPDLDITRNQVTRMTCRINATAGTC